jgi:endonuclease/exonuclease/phosphatase (EEP) superfamily protein YafD
VAATVAWTVFLVLFVLLTGRWWPWYVVQILPPLTLVAVPLLLLLLVPFVRPVRRGLAVALVVLLLAGAHLAGYGPGWGTATAAPAGTTVKVFAWSTDFWQMSDDKDAFYAFLRRQHADVYLLQEYLYWRGDRPVRIDDSARLHAEFPGYRLAVQGELITLSRLPVVAQDHRHVPGSGNDWYWKGTKFQRTDLRVGARTVSFYNVHLPVPFHLGNPFKGSTYRGMRNRGLWWTREVHKLRQDVARNAHPAVVAGDFNSPWMGLSPLGAGTRTHSPDGSWLPARSWPVSDYRLPRLWRLDWLFTDPDIAVSDYRFGGGTAFSDHAAQQIRLVVPDGTASAHSARTR